MCEFRDDNQDNIYSIIVKALDGQLFASTRSS